MALCCVGFMGRCFALGAAQPAGMQSFGNCGICIKQCSAACPRCARNVGQRRTGLCLGESRSDRIGHHNDRLPPQRANAICRLPACVLRAVDCQWTHFARVVWARHWPTDRARRLGSLLHNPTHTTRRLARRGAFMAVVRCRH